MKVFDVKISRFSKDIVLSFMASTVLVATLQLIVYPFLSDKFGQVVFGSVLSLMGAVNTLAMMSGGALDNVRLLKDQEYKAEGIVGDFKVIIRYASFVNTFVITVVAFLFTGRLNVFDIILLILITLLSMMRSYLSVEYRLRINYTLIFLYNLSVSAGYIIGVVITILTGIWQITFICGELCALVFAFFTAEFFKEPVKKTRLFKSTLVCFIQLAITTALGGTLIYLDRFILLPLMGEVQVAVFFAASVFGKLISMAFQPVSGVLLTYLAQSRQKLKLVDFWKFNLAVVVISGLFYVVCLIIAPGITGMLYPKLIKDALGVLHIANLTAIITTMGSLTQPVLLKFSSMHYQIILQSIFGASYILSGVISLKMYGLPGFCAAALFSSSLRLVIMWGMGSYTLSGKKTREEFQS